MTNNQFDILRRLGTPKELAGLFGVTRQTVANWRAGRTSPRAIQVYEICVALRIRPQTFAQSGDFGPDSSIVHFMGADSAVTPALMGAWVRERLAQCRDRREDDFVDTTKSIAHRAGMHHRTAFRVAHTDEVKWSQLVSYIRHGLGVSPYALLKVGTQVPRARIRYSRPGPWSPPSDASLTGEKVSDYREKVSGPNYNPFTGWGA